MVGSITLNGSNPTDFVLNTTGMSATVAPSGQTTIHAQGKLEFQFTVPDNAAFFRLQSQ